MKENCSGKNCKYSNNFRVSKYGFPKYLGNSNRNSLWDDNHFRKKLGDSDHFVHSLARACLKGNWVILSDFVEVMPFKVTDSKKYSKF